MNSSDWSPEFKNTQRLVLDPVELPVGEDGGG
jgi:hypothetical protein